MMRPTLFGVAVASAALLVPTAALAHGGTPEVFTDVVRDTQVVPFEGPCGGGSGMVTIDFHDTFHITEFDDGHAVVTGTQAGSFAFEPDDPTAPGSSGRYRNGITNTFMMNAGTATSVFTVVGRDDNGDKVQFQVRSHVTFANGEVRVEHFTVGCG